MYIACILRGETVAFDQHACYAALVLLHRPGPSIMCRGGWRRLPRRHYLVWTTQQAYHAAMPGCLSPRESDAKGSNSGVGPYALARVSGTGHRWTGALVGYFFRNLPRCKRVKGPYGPCRRWNTVRNACKHCLVQFVFIRGDIGGVEASACDAGYKMRNALRNSTTEDDDLWGALSDVEFINSINERVKNGIIICSQRHRKEIGRERVTYSTRSDKPYSRLSRGKKWKNGPFACSEVFLTGLYKTEGK
ncbi:hypothetical protein ARMSODRAFT_971201 [Armillaria solidipes]|uniref:Uncharacterized protein n=1 Tax=Armillaria solidipes TaxID=1076256 RepID=A0A2H3BWN3_9AGAR|nr:hypothetical protein ARMSODRAFT_971201 [Armillaria solidipes]